MQQREGVYLAEFYWMKRIPGGTNNHEWNYHVVAINCNLRIVMCNTFGVIPFVYAGRHVDLERQQQQKQQQQRQRQRRW